jgi:hypothetical protein
MNRLLTDEEFEEAASLGRNFYPVLKAQDAKTLKVVGNLLQIELDKKRYTGNLRLALKKIVESLRQGKLPEANND